MGTQSARNRLTPAADATIDEYAAGLRAEILEEASALSRDGSIRPEDVVNAYGSLQARKQGTAYDPLEVFLLERAVRSERFSVIWLFVALVALAFTLINGVFLALGMTPAGDLWDGLTIALSVAGLAAVTSAVIFTNRSIQERREAVRRAELARQISTLTRTARTTSVLSTLGDVTSIDFRLGVGGQRDEKKSDARLNLLLLSLWIDVEKNLRQLATLALGISEADAQGYPIGELLRMLFRDGVLDEAVLNETRSMLTVRNQLVHATGQSFGDPEAAARQMHRLASTTRRLIDEYLRLAHDVEHEERDSANREGRSAL